MSDQETLLPFFNDGTRIWNGDHAEEAGFAPCGWRDLYAALIKDFEVVDGEESYADSVISTRRGIDPAVSGRSASSAFRR